jgi:DNA-directed RNA polymerase specialized sigma24 family protein
MRQILIHQARSIRAGKRGGGLQHLPLEAELAWTGSAAHPESLDLDAALDELERLDEPSVRAIELRYIFGFTTGETASLLGASRSTVDRHVRFALTWLHGRLHPES